MFLLERERRHESGLLRCGRPSTYNVLRDCEGELVLSHEYLADALGLEQR
jgi:hypothetical protein